MEDIYDDLNNYEDVNCVQELRNENKVLKVKLEEHSAAMEKLQKDYDKLEIEFKKMETNYSSLLKTARSEIQRKTQRITQLNMEKDMMLLESLKNGKNIRRNFNTMVQGNKKGEETIKMKNKRCRTTGVQTDNYSNSGADNRVSMESKFDNVSAKPEMSYKSNSIVREKTMHHKTEYKNTPKTCASSIKDRRKSMPVVSMPLDTFSSDEENEHIYAIRETRTDSIIQDKFEKRYMNRFLMDRNSNKTSETSSIDDRASNYRENNSREMYRDRSSRYENNSYRSRDKYKTSLKYQKDHSSERGQKRQHSLNEYQDDYYKQEQGRYRPRDNPSEYDRYQRRTSDHKASHDRYSYDHEKYRHNYEEKYGAKQKMSNDYDEPLKKRHKSEYFHNLDVHNRVEKEYYNDKESMDLQSKLSPQQYDDLRLSCQSPDFVYTDAALAHPIKEIRSTATMPLDDPRVTSKRYELIKDNGKETLFAVMGRNIDIKSVNKSLWKIERVKIPDALMRRPSQTSYELVKDIDSPVVNLSFESGEIRFESENEGHATREESKVIPHTIQDCNRSRKVPVDHPKQVISSEEMSKLNVSKYRIPKICQNKRSSESKKDVPIIDVNDSVPSKNLNIKATVEDDFSNKLLTRHQNDVHVNIVSSNNNVSKHDNKEINNQVTLSKMEIVADDLELSDENSDNMDSHRQIVKEKVTKYCKIQPNIRQKDSFTDDPKKRSDNIIIANRNKTKEPADTIETKEVKVDEEAKNKSLSGSPKNLKSKKKKPKSKEVSKDSIEDTDAVPVTDKKNKSKKEKECKETNTKFGDLFGDSSSLMTPEDLGIPTYLPISEDAQDAVDLKINEIINATSIMDEAQSSSGNVAQRSIDEQEVEHHDDKVKIDLQKSNPNDKIVTKNVKKKISHKKEEIETDEISPSDVYENLNPATDSNESDIVKMVIISTGVQPQITLENDSEAVLEKLNADVEVHTKASATDCYSVPAHTGLKKQDVLKALATSTPHKDTVLNSVTEIKTNDVTIVDPSSTKTIECVGDQTVNQTNKNLPDSQDTPDVRIFVKRRRKVMKRSPMT